MNALHALTRDPGRDLVGFELVHRSRSRVDPDRAIEQHLSYREALASLGAEVELLPSLPGHPDAVFVEDTALVLDELAVVTRPGAASRRGETETVAEALAPHRPLARIAAPATVDGGDVLRFGRTIFVGRSQRSNPEGHEALAAVAAPHGYRVTSVDLHGCLHLKSAVCDLGGERILANRAWIDEVAFAGFELVDVDPGESHAANVLPVGAGVLVLASAPRTAEKLSRLGVDVHAVDVSEFEKMEASLTCLSLVFPR